MEERQLSKLKHLQSHNTHLLSLILKLLTFVYIVLFKLYGTLELKGQLYQA